MVLLTVIWLTVVLFLWMRLEEKFLEQKFEWQYQEYKAKVPMILPRLINKKTIQKNE